MFKASLKFKPPFAWLNCFHVVLVALTLMGGACQNESKNGESVAARVGDEKISFVELDATIQNQLYENLFAVYYIRKIALEELIAEELLQQEAESLGISKQELVAKQIQTHDSEERLKRFVSDRKLEAGIPDVKNPIRLIALESTEGQNALRDAYEKDIIIELVDVLKKKYEIESFLSSPIPPRLDLSKLSGHSRGSQSPIVEIWIASDFTCSECQKHFDLFEALFKKYQDKARFHFSHLSTQASLASVVSECAALQGKFWEMHDLIFQNRAQDTTAYFELAARINMNKNTLTQCLVNSSDLQKRINANIAELTDLGMIVTPSIIIDGRVYYGELTLEKMSQYLDEIISKRLESK